MSTLFFLLFFFFFFFFFLRWLLILHDKYKQNTLLPAYFDGFKYFSLTVSSKVPSGWLSFLFSCGRNSVVCMIAHVALPKVLHQHWDQAQLVAIVGYVMFERGACGLRFLMICRVFIALLGCVYSHGKYSFMI